MRRLPILPPTKMRPRSDLPFLIEPSEVERLREFLRSGLRVGGFLETVRRAHCWVDEKVEQMGSDDRGCEGPGCAHCCRLPAYVQPGELFRLVEAIQTLGARAVANIRARTVAAFARTRGLSDEERIAADVACPLLDEEEQCAVYAARPLSCRAHSGVDARVCATGRGDPAAERFDLVGDAVVGLTAQAAMAAAMEESGLDGEPVELVRALHVVLGDRKAARAFRRGERVFARAKERNRRAS
jgi:Fe-S-cluster containining protein